MIETLVICLMPISGFLKIVMPSSPDELAAEGNALHHCVGGYVDRIARKECIVLFLRRREDMDKPFYTVEARD